MVTSGLRSLPYKETLRAIGAWLDQRDAGYFTIIETPDGFTVVVAPVGGRSTPEETHFRYAELGRHGEVLRQNRGKRTKDAPPQTEMFPTGCQDFFRALGFELDDAGAEAVVIDSLDERVVLSYAYVDPSADFSWHKRMVILGRNDCSTVLEVAKARRRPEQSAGLFSGWRRQPKPSSTR
jgi:hypothetical protein